MVCRAVQEGCEWVGSRGVGWGGGGLFDIEVEECDAGAEGCFADGTVGGSTGALFDWRFRF